MEGDGILSDMCCIVSGSPACPLGDWCSDLVGDDSSKRSSTTMFGSVREESRLEGFDVFLVEVPVFARLLDFWALALDAYSGRSAKLLGVTTTL